MPNILKYYLQISLSAGLIPNCTHLCYRRFSVNRAISGKAIQSILVFLKISIIQSNCTIQNLLNLQKHSIYTQEVLKSISNIIKSPKKEEKAVIKHLWQLYFSAFSGLFLLYSFHNSSIYDIS